MGTGSGWCAGYLSLALFFIIQKSSNKVYNFGIGSKVLLSIISFSHKCVCVCVGYHLPVHGRLSRLTNQEQKIFTQDSVFIFIRASQSNLEAESSCHLDCYYDDVNAMSKSVTSYSVKRKSVAFLEAKKHSNLSKLFLSVHCPRLAIVPTTTGVYVCKATK